MNTETNNQNQEQSIPEVKKHVTAIRDVRARTPRVEAKRTASRHVPEGVNVDRSGLHIKSVKVGQKFLLSPGMVLQDDLTHIVDVTVTITDEGPRPNVLPGTVFLVLEKDQQKMKVRFKMNKLDPMIGRRVSHDATMWLFFRRNVELHVDTVYQDLDRNKKFERPTPPEQHARRTDNERAIDREFRQYSKL